MPTFSERAKAVGLPDALVWAGLAVAFLLSVLLHFGICTDACKATYKWTISAPGPAQVRSSLPSSWKRPISQRAS